MSDFSNNELDISTPHPLYKELARKYNVALDAFSGDVTKYVPRLSTQTQSEYDDYTQRASFFNVVERTATSIVGALTRKQFDITGDFPVTEYGNPDIFLQYGFRDQLLGGRTAVLVDVDNVTKKSKLVMYDADDIINWGDGFYVIREVALVRDKKNPYKLVEETSYRELYLDEVGTYQVRLWSKVDDKWVIEQIAPMMINGATLDYIPLWPITPFDNSWDIYTPPLFTQASINIQHFKSACDLGHYAHFMALPTVVIAGELASYEEEMFVMAGQIGADGTVATESGRQTVTKQTTFQLGSTHKPLHLTTGSSAEYMEVSGSSFTMLRDNLKDLEERMFLSGGRLLSSKKGVESVEALSLRSASEAAVLETITNAFESAINKALETCALIDRTQVAVITLNKDFTGQQMAPAEVKSLLELYVAQTITLDQLLDQLYKGEVVSTPEQLSIPQ